MNAPFSRDLDRYSAKGDVLEAPDGACLFRPADEGRASLSVKSGAVRGAQTNGAGRTVVLYHVEAGDSCVLTTTCLLSNKPCSGYGNADGPVCAIAMSTQTFRSLLNTDTRFPVVSVDEAASNFNTIRSTWE